MIKILSLVVLFIIVIIIFIPFKIQIILNNSKVDVNLLLFGLFNVRIDVDKLAQKYLKNNEDKFSFKKITTLIKTNYILKTLIYDILNCTVVDLLTCEMHCDIQKPHRIVILNYLYLNVLNFIENKVKKIKLKKFHLFYKEEENVCVNIVFRSYIFVVIYFMFKHINLVIKSFKYLKEVKKSESSN